MPVIWKKAKKIGRISRLISDFRSKRRQSSLPLQTGFPTSLADLFIKNKDRLKKSPKTHSEKPPPSPPSSEIISETHSPINPSPTHEKISSESISEHTSDVDNLEIKSEEYSEERLSNVSKNVSDVDLEDPISPPNPKRTLSVGSMVFLVLGLALGTKKVALVVTLSFLAISLLQFARKRVAFFSQHCEDANKRFGSVIGAYVSEPREGEPSMIKRSQVTNSSTRSLTRSYQIGYMEDDFVEVENLNIHKEGSGKLKSKGSKRLKPKKGKGMKCGRVGKEEEASSCLSRESSDCIEQVGAEKQEEEEEDELDCVLLEDDSSCSVGGIACSRTRMINWPNFVLIVLILSGLVVGRLLALVLTILWCLLVKSSETLWQKLKMYRINSSLL